MPRAGTNSPKQFRLATSFRDDDSLPRRVLLPEASLERCASLYSTTAGCDGTPVVFSSFVTTLRSTRNAEELLELQGEMVVVTVKQYLAVADDVLRKLFPELPAGFWAHSAQYPTCSVFIKEDEPDAALH